MEFCLYHRCLRYFTCALELFFYEKLNRWTVPSPSAMPISEKYGICYFFHRIGWKTMAQETRKDTPLHGFLKIRCWRGEICVITFWLSPISTLGLRPSVLLQSLLVHTQDSQYSQCWFKLKSWFSFWVFLLQSSKKWGILHQAVQTLMERMVSFSSWTSWRLSGICWALQLVIAWPKAPTETRVTWSRLVTDTLGICYSLLWKIAQV